MKTKNSLVIITAIAAAALASVLLTRYLELAPEYRQYVFPVSFAVLAVLFPWLALRGLARSERGK